MEVLHIQVPPVPMPLGLLVERALESREESSVLDGEGLVVTGCAWQGNLRRKDPSWMPEPSGGPVTLVIPRKPIVPFTLPPDAVRWEQEGILAVWKPADVNTCPSVYSDIDCLSAGVADLLASRGSSHVPAVIHRLDRAARGLVLFGSDRESEAFLYRLFAQRKIHKHYLAACPVPPDPGKHWRFEGDQEHRGKVRHACTLVHRLPDMPDLTGAGGEALARFLACPVTGRPHQIRKHFAEGLRPLEGDIAYGGAEGGSRLELACVGYRFRHPSGPTVRIRVRDPWLDRP